MTLLLTYVTGPWPLVIATVLLFLSGVGFIPGYPDYRGAWFVHLIAAFCILAVGINFLDALGLLP